MDLATFLKELKKRPDAKSWRFVQVKDHKGDLTCSLVSSVDGRNIVAKNWKEVVRQLQ